LPQQAQSHNALVRILLGLLQFTNSLADFARLKIELPQFKANGKVGWIFGRALLTFGQLEGRLSD
jgi:hypothetical protein